MIIRPAILSDAELLADLAAVTMREAFGPPHNSTELVEEYVQSAITVPILEAELADPKSTFFLASLQDGIPIGYAKLRRHTPPRQMPKLYQQPGKAIEIQRIYLSQAHIGQGQGRELMNYCLEWAKQRGYVAVWLGVWERNERALAFYKRIGFEQFGYHYFQFGSERQRDFWLQKQLYT